MFPPDFTTELRERLDGTWGKGKDVGQGDGSESGFMADMEGGADESGEGGRASAEQAASNNKFKTSTFKPATTELVEIAGSAAVVDDVDGMEVDGEDLEGEAITMDF